MSRERTKPGDEPSRDSTKTETTNGEARPSGGTRTGELRAEVREIKDSRGRPTVQVVLYLSGVEGRGDVPAGASKGEDEARTVAVDKALANVKNIILPMLREADVDLRKHDNLLKLEWMLIERAGADYESLGANAVLPVSRALWQLAARLRQMELAHYIRKYEPELAGDGRVAFLMNIFNGGLHAAKDGEKLGTDRIDIQEVMVVPSGATNYREALQMGDRIDAALKDLLEKRYGEKNVTRADEAGFSVKGLGDSSAAIAHVFESIERAGYSPGEEVKLALDVAASSFFDKAKNVYNFGGKSLTSDEMIAYLEQVVDRYPGKILSIEDGLDENDWEGWTKLSASMKKRGVVTIGDDLFVTQMKRLRRGVNNNSAHAILIKVNQNGSVTGTIEVMKYAKQHGLQCIVSHRSGETVDDSIADLAFATGAFGLKTGDPQPVLDFPDPTSWVRRRKYLRMIELEEGRR
jgi:enolase